MAFSENINRVKPGWVRAAALMAYLLSMLLPPFQAREQALEFVGLFVLFTGWLTIWPGFALPGLAWLANPLVILSLTLMKRQPNFCAVLSLVATFLSLGTFFALGRMSYGFDSSREIYLGEIVGLKVGAYLWMLSIVLCLAGSLSYQRHKGVNTSARKIWF
jgi:hypothetical protein